MKFFLLLEIFAISAVFASPGLKTKFNKVIGDEVRNVDLDQVRSEANSFLKELPNKLENAPQMKQLASLWVNFKKEIQKHPKMAQKLSRAASYAKITYDAAKDAKQMAFDAITEAIKEEKTEAEIAIDNIAPSSGSETSSTGSTRSQRYKEKLNRGAKKVTGILKHPRVVLKLKEVKKTIDKILNEDEELRETLNNLAVLAEIRRDVNKRGRQAFMEAFTEAIRKEEHEASQNTANLGLKNFQ